MVVHTQSCFYGNVIMWHRGTPQVWKGAAQQLQLALAGHQCLHVQRNTLRKRRPRANVVRAIFSRRGLRLVHLLCRNSSSWWRRGGRGGGPCPSTPGLLICARCLQTRPEGQVFTVKRTGWWGIETDGPTKCFHARPGEASRARGTCVFACVSVRCV